MYKTLVKLSREIPSIRKIEGSSLTIPGMAPDLIDILKAAIDGEPLPTYGGVPLFDNTEDIGLARVSVSELDNNDLNEIVAGDRRQEEQLNERRKDEEERSDDKDATSQVTEL